MAIMAAETTTGRAAESSHWYAKDGSCVYEIRGANGAMRPVTLRDARKLGLLPGFSSIAQMEYKPALERWKIEQALMAALTLPRLPDEDDGAFLNRAREDSYEQAKKAAARGTSIHAAIQGHFENQPCTADDLPYVMPAEKYLEQRFAVSGGWVAEKSFAHPLGYGGKCDLWHPEIPVVVDFKCKDFGPDKSAKDLAWPEMCMQLAAYREGLGTPKATCVNIFVSTRVPGLIVCREWDESECVENWEVFRNLLRVWQIRRGYNGSFTQEKAA